MVEGRGKEGGEEMRRRWRGEEEDGEETRG
jgi:hypothetical protein